MLSHARAVARAAPYFAPVGLWLVLFSFGVALVPDALKPHINTTLMPWLDAWCAHSATWFANDGDWPVLDVLAAVPYTVHPVLPLVFIVATLATSRKHRLLKFVFVFGIMNLSAVLTHITFPTTPPWYFVKYGTAEAHYGMKGDPALLSRVDKMFNITMYQRMYEDGGKVVFGTWPSLHAAWPYLMASFRPRLRLGWMRAFQWVYVVWVWWAAVYLQHHYFVDLLGGVLYAEGAMWVGKKVIDGGLEWDQVPMDDDNLVLPLTGKDTKRGGETLIA